MQAENIKIMFYSRWSHRSSLGIIIDEEEEEDDKSEAELNDKQASIESETDALLFSSKSKLKYSGGISPDVTGHQKLKANGQSSPNKLVGLPCQYAIRDTKYPTQCGKHGRDTKEVVEMQFLTPRRNFRKRSELHPVDEYFEIGDTTLHTTHDRYYTLVFDKIPRQLHRSKHYQRFTD